MPVVFDELCRKPSRVVEAMTPRTVEEVTHRGITIATIRRPALKSDVPDGIEVVQVADLQRARDGRAQALREGGSFAIGCFGRRIAVVEGVKA